MADIVHHNIEVRSGILALMGANFGRRYIAVCKTCGWQGRDMPTAAAADRDGDAHSSAVA